MAASMNLVISLLSLLLFSACLTSGDEEVVSDGNNGQNNETMESSHSLLPSEEVPSLSIISPHSLPYSMDAPSLSAVVPPPDPHSVPSTGFCYPQVFLDTVLSRCGVREAGSPCRGNELINLAEKAKKIKCIPRNLTLAENGTLDLQVEMVNSSGLLHTLTARNETDGHCFVVLFFTPWCMFCARMAVQYNALARAFPQLHVLAIDAAQVSNLNSRFGTIAVPNILIFHNAKVVARFNNTVRTLESFSNFITNVTGVRANSSVMVEPEDFEGPLSSVPSSDPDYLLWLSWAFMFVFFGTIFGKSSLGQRLIAAIHDFGHEHHHQHID